MEKMCLYKYIHIPLLKNDAQLRKKVASKKKKKRKRKSNYPKLL